MGKHQHDLTTNGVLDAYHHAILTGPLFGGPDNSKVMDKILAQISDTPIEDLVGTCAKRKDFDLAVTFLNNDYNQNQPGSPEDRALAKLGMGMVDAAIADKKFNIAEWAFKRACEIYPPESPERREVIHRMFQVHGDCLAANGPGLADGFSLADVILKHAAEIYPPESAEYQKAVKQQKEEFDRRLASNRLGAGKPVKIVTRRPMKRPDAPAPESP